jgi:D-alanyl-lipoteichoic acid acyltransferase DltB (MBOAT superfamily)
LIPFISRIFMELRKSSRFSESDTYRFVVFLTRFSMPSGIGCLRILLVRIFFAYESIFRVFENAYTKIKSIPDGMLLIEITLLRAVKRREYDSIKLDSALTKNGKMGVRGEDTV